MAKPVCKFGRNKNNGKCLKTKRARKGGLSGARRRRRHRR